MEPLNIAQLLARAEILAGPEPVMSDWTPNRGRIYRPYAVNPLGAPVLVVRTHSDAAPMVAALSEAVRSVNAEVLAYDVFPMEALVDRSTRERRFVMLLLSAYALSALLLAGGRGDLRNSSAGGVAADPGDRVAYGAGRVAGDVLQMVLGQGLRLVAGLTGLMRSILFEVRPLDPVAFLAAGGVPQG